MSDQTFWELRAEWLALRGCLFDPNTGLPALPAVVEDVRRRLEAGEPLGLVYVTLAGSDRLEAICGWQSYDRLLKWLAAAVVDFRDRVLGPRGIVALNAVRGDEILLFVGTAPGAGGIGTGTGTGAGAAAPGAGEGAESAAEGEGGGDRLSQLCERLGADLEGRMRPEAGGEVPPGASLSYGSAPIRLDPTVRIERSIYQAVEEVRTLCHRARERQHGQRRTELRRILAARDVLIRYQPIVRLDDGAIHGFEALSTGPSGDIFENPEMMFSFAEETEQIVELERLCRTKAIRGAASLSSPQKLFVNCSARGFVDPQLTSPKLLDEVRKAGRAPGDIVFEVTERVAITEWAQFRSILADLRSMGFSIAIDDMGAGYSSLQAVAEVEPDYLKFDVSLVRDIHLSPIKRNLLETLVVLARKIDARVIAEGVESLHEFEALRAMDVTFAQGFYFAVPAALPTPAPLHLRERFIAP